METYRCIGVVGGSGVLSSFLCGFAIALCVARGGTDVSCASFSGVGQLGGVSDGPSRERMM
jgi:hypothetical protein